jgi:hypothetical protein
MTGTHLPTIVICTPADATVTGRLGRALVVVRGGLENIVAFDVSKSERNMGIIPNGVTISKAGRNVNKISLQRYKLVALSSCCTGFHFLAKDTALYSRFLFVFMYSLAVDQTGLHLTFPLAIFSKITA